MAGEGKRAGSRRAARPRPTFRPRLLLLAVGVTLAVVAWGYLVYAAIDFGSSARSGDGRAWVFLALASAGAIACLFLGLMMIAHLLRGLGITAPPPSASNHASNHASDPASIRASDETEPATPPAPRPPGGRRAAR